MVLTALTPPYPSMPGWGACLRSASLPLTALPSQLVPAAPSPGSTPATALGDHPQETCPAVGPALSPGATQPPPLQSASSGHSWSPCVGPVPWLQDSWAAVPCPWWWQRAARQLAVPGSQDPAFPSTGKGPSGICTPCRLSFLNQPVQVLRFPPQAPLSPNFFVTAPPLSHLSQKMHLRFLSLPSRTSLLVPSPSGQGGDAGQ